MTEQHLKENFEINSFGHDYQITIDGNCIKSTTAIIIYDSKNLLKDYLASVNVSIHKMKQL